MKSILLLIHTLISGCAAAQSGICAPHTASQELQGVKDDTIVPKGKAIQHLFGLPSRVFNEDDFNRIKTIVFKVSTAHSWNFGNDSLQIKYEREGSFFKITQSRFKRNAKAIPLPLLEADALLESGLVERRFETEQLFNILQSLFLPKFQLDENDFFYKKSKFKIDLDKIPKGGFNQYTTCDDCSLYNLDLQFIEDNDKIITIHLIFDTGFELHLERDTKRGKFQVRQMLEWMYLYQLCHLFLPENTSLNNTHFNEKAIDRLATWAREYFPELNK